MKGAPGALLLVDTCGEHGSVALVREEEVLAEVVLPERAASSGLLSAVRQVMTVGQTSLKELSGTGVVSGPGSFTGLRVGLAVCKGLCEATTVPLAAVSRLKVLEDAAALRDGYAVLRAGRDQVYVREIRAGIFRPERLMGLDSLLRAAEDQDVAIAELSLLPALQQGTARVRHVEIRAKDALAAVAECLARGGSDLALTDANYVRDEEAIYARAKG